MKRIPSRVVLAVLLSSIGINSLYFLPNSWNAARSYFGVWGLANYQRRFLQRGQWYRAVLQIESQVPTNATMRLVSSAPPWYLMYFLYPRLLKKGSLSLLDREKIRGQYPNDWVLVYSGGNAAEMTAYPPLKSMGS